MVFLIHTEDYLEKTLEPLHGFEREGLREQD